MINLQISERMIFKIVGLIPNTIAFPENKNSYLKEVNFDLLNINIYENEKGDATFNLTLSGIKLFLKLFKLEIPIFKMNRTSGEVKIKLLFRFDKRTNHLLITPIIIYAKLSKVPNFIIFLAKSIFNVFFRHKARINLKMVDMNLEGISLKRRIVINNVKTDNKTINMIGHLDNHLPKNEKLEISDETSAKYHSEKDIVLLMDTDFVDEVFFEILPKFFSTGVLGVPDIEFKSSHFDMFDNNRVRLTLTGKLLDSVNNPPFIASMNGKFEYVRAKQHIQISDINTEKIEIEHSAYNALKNIIELFIKAYLLIPISIPNPMPLTIPMDEIGTNIKLMFSNISYNVNKDLFIASMDVFN